MLKKFGGEVIFRGNISYKDISKMGITSEFLINVLQAWSKINYKETLENIGKEMVWNNSRIKDNNQEMFFYKSWYDRGIQYIEHLYNYRDRTFYDFQSFKNLYEVEDGDFLNYNILINNIPQEWKDILMTETINSPQRLTLFMKINDKMKFSKFFYVKLVEAKRPVVNKAQTKWNDEFSNNDIDWSDTFRQPMKLTIDTRLREFQYKYLMRIIPNNQFLLKCSLTTHSLCDFCGMNIETNKHMFWDCNMVQELWHNIKIWLQVQLNVAYLQEFSYPTITLNNNKWSTDSKLNTNINFIILLTKYFIYSKKVQGEVPKIDVFLSYFNYRLKLEETIAIVKNNYEYYRATWDKFIN